MNFSYSLPRRSNRLNPRILAAIIILAFLILMISQLGGIFQTISGNLASMQPASAAAFRAVPQAVPVPTPSTSNAKHMVPHMSATPSPVVFQPTAQPVATPPVGK